MQPLYTLRESGEGTYPVLRYVLVSFGKDVGYGPTLASALNDVLGITDGDEPFGDPDDPAEPGVPEEPEEPGQPGGPGVSDDVASLLEEAEEAFAEAEQALQEGDFAGYGEAQERARDLVAQALEAAGASAAPSAEPSPGEPSPSGSAESSAGE